MFCVLRVRIADVEWSPVCSASDKACGSTLSRPLSQMVMFSKFRLGPSVFIQAALLCVGLFPMALAVHYVTTNWISLPFWDEWHTPGSQFESWCRGTLTLGELFSQHNESRKFFPRLLYFTLASVGGWDVRKEMTIVFLEVCLLSILLLRLLSRTEGTTGVSTLVTWVVMMFLCFSSVQFENFLYGIQLEPFFPGIALVAIANINLSALSFRSKLLANLTLASIATYTFANGMLLLVLGLPLANPSNSTPIRKRTRWFCIYALCASAVFAAVFASMIVILIQDRNWHTFYPWLLIAAYALGTGIITALGRIGFGVQQALDNRYTVFSLFFYLALVGGTFALYCARVRRGGQGVRACFLTNIGYLLGFTALCWTACYPKNFVSLRNHRHHQLQLRLALEWMDVIPDNPELALVFPYVKSRSPLK